MKEVRVNGVNINFSNKWLYTLILILIFGVVGVSVYAFGTTNPEVFGHSISEIQPCAVGEILQTNFAGDGWECASLPIVPVIPTISESITPWTTVGSEIYYTGYTGVGVTNPSMKLHVANNLGACSKSASTCYKYIAAFNQNPSNQNSGPQMLIGYRNRGTTISTATTEGYIRSGNSYPLVIGTSGSKTALYMANNGRMTGLFSSTSDIRLKKNVNELTGSLDKLKQIRGVSFEWNEKYRELGKPTGGRQIGVIAQEVEKVFPELVSPGQEDYLTIDYSKISAVLIEAIKEQQVQIDKLQKEVDKLNNNS